MGPDFHADLGLDPVEKIGRKLGLQLVDVYCAYSIVFRSAGTSVGRALGAKTSSAGSERNRSQWVAALSDAPHLFALFRQHLP